MILTKIILENLVNRLLFESDTLKRNLGKDPYHPVEKIAKFVDKKTPEGMCLYAFTMVSVPKVGINPGYKYNTPLGIYFYPLDKYRFYQLRDDELPFVSGLENFGLVKIKNPEKWLNVGVDKKYNLKAYHYAVKKNLEKILPMVNPKTSFPDFETILEMAKSGRHWGISDSANLFDFSYMLARSMSEIYNNKLAFIWSTSLRYFGIEGIYDDGMGIIHPSEPAQLVAFTKNAIEVIEMFGTKHFRKKTSVNYYLNSYEKSFQYIVDLYKYINEPVPEFAENIENYYKHASRAYSSLHESLIIDEIFKSVALDLVKENKKEKLNDLNDFHIEFIVDNCELMGISYFQKNLDFLDPEDYFTLSVIDHFSKNGKDSDEIMETIAEKIKGNRDLIKRWHYQLRKKGLGDEFLKGVARAPYNFPDWVFYKIRNKIDIFSKDLNAEFESQIVSDFFAKGLKDRIVKLSNASSTLYYSDFHSIIAKLRKYKFSNEAFLEIARVIHFVLQNEKMNNTFLRVLKNIFVNTRVFKPGNETPIKEFFSVFDKETIVQVLSCCVSTQDELTKQIVIKGALERKMEIEEYKYTSSDGFGTIILYSLSSIRKILNDSKNEKEIIYILSLLVTCNLSNYDKRHFAESLANAVSNIPDIRTDYQKIKNIRDIVISNSKYFKDENEIIFEFAKDYLSIHKSEKDV